MWDAKLDARLLKLQSEGFTFSEIGMRIGVSRNAAIGRYHRIGGRVFPSKLRQIAESKRISLDRKLKLAEAQSILISGLRSDLSGGIRRDDAIVRALSNGATLQSVGDELGLTRQRVHQIAGNI